MASTGTTIGAVPVALIGCGRRGTNRARAFADLGALAAVCDSNPAAAAEFASRFEVPALSLDAVLADPDIPAVALATPPVQHHPIARQAMAAGKHVLVERPLAVDVADAERLGVLAREHRRILMTGHQQQHHRAFLKLKELLDGGVLGQLRHIHANSLNIGAPGEAENVLWGFAPDDISMILALAGMEPDTVEAVAAWCLHDDTPDVTTVHLGFANGVRAQAQVSCLPPLAEQRLVVIGGLATAVFDDGQPWDRKLMLFRHRIDGIDGQAQTAGSGGECVPLEPADPLTEECKHFLSCIEAGTPPRNSGDDGVRVLRVLRRAQLSVAKAAATPSPAEVPRLPSRQSTERPVFDGVTIHESAYVDTPSQIGAGTRIWHFSHILPGVRIGRNVTVGQNVVVGPDVSVGDRCKIQNNVSVYKGVTLEDDVFCGPSCVFTNVMNPRAEIERKSEFLPTLVKRGATIGANATIVCGSTLGEYCFIAAGAVVTEDVPAHALMAGVPARRIGWFSRAGARLGEDLVCPLTGTRYAMTEDGRLRELT